MPDPVSTIVRRPVRVLAPAVVERIAAGEVVERPASVVRELIENALDAAATSIAVEIEQGGLRLIRVADDGWGIPADEIELAVRQHATSKISSFEDLTVVSTLGFRGEALASIATLGELRLCSAADAHGLATAFTLHGGMLVSREHEARARGTTVIVRDLFAEVPARRAALRSSSAETTLVMGVVREYALGHASVRFSLAADGHLLIHTPGSDIAGAFLALYGADLARSLVSVHTRGVGAARVGGWVGGRAFTQRDARHVVICVNGRPVRNSALVAAVQAGYRPLLRKGRHPVALLAITTEPGDVDANVHPAKRHVLLRDERALSMALREGVHSALGVQAVESPRPLTIVGHSYQRILQPTLPTRRPRHGMREPRPLYAPHRIPAWTSSRAEAVLENDLTPLGQLDDRLIVAQSATGDLVLVDQHRAHELLLYEDLCKQALTHQRVDRAATLGEADGRLGGQMLLEPLIVELSARQAQILTARLAELALMGLVCEPFGGATFLVRALPVLPEGTRSVAALAPELAADAAVDADDWLDHLRTSLACRSALRRGQPLALDEQRALLRDLARASVPAVCPHGSPIVVRWSLEAMTRAFEW